MLAAGLSRRMGGPNKLLQPYRGKPLLAHALRVAEEIEFADRIAVTGRDCAETEALAASFGFRCVFNPSFAEGLGTSIAAGVRALQPEAEGAFIALGDMPEIGPEVYRALAETFTQGSIVAPLHNGARGHPVLFCKSYIAQLSRCRATKARVRSCAVTRSLLQRLKPQIQVCYATSTHAKIFTAAGRKLII